MSDTPQSFELKITRVFDAPRELVWKAWTDPEMAMQWMGPRGFQATEFVTTTEPGGHWHLSMEGNIPGTEQLACLAQGGTTLEIKPPELLIYTFGWDNRANVGLTESPHKENIVTVRFEELGSKTIMHFTQAPFGTAGERDGHTGGWNSSFDRFAEFILTAQPGKKFDPNDIPTELHLRRFFTAPRQLIFDAWIKPELLAQWWGPKGFTAPRCEVDAKQGGLIHIDMQAPDGTVFGMTGRFMEVYPPYRFHFTSSPLAPDGKPVMEIWNSVFFEEKDGGTEITLDVHVISQTPAAPQYLKGMPVGWQQTLDKLDAFVTGRAS